MKNFRIWSVDNKKCEAVWLEYLLILCGSQVWKGRLSEKNLKLHGKNSKHRYIDILLFEDIDWRLCNSIADYNSLGVYFACGKSDKSMPHEVYAWGSSRELNMEEPETLIDLLDYLCLIMADGQQERTAILRLTKNYISENNVLTKSIYAITELFCSRRLNYTGYKGIDILLNAVINIEKWYKEYLSALDEKLTYSEVFTITYLQNLTNEGYIKAHKKGGYDTSILLKNANYLKKLKPEAVAVQFLKLQILHNCINCDEHLEDILYEIIEKSAPEYVSKAYCELGDLLRDNENWEYRHSADEYYEELNDDFECYRGIYKLGLLYEDRGYVEEKWYYYAEKKYALVLKLIESIQVKNRTPQEFEYYCKAFYAKIKMQLLLDDINGTLSGEKKAYYDGELKKLIIDCDKFQEGIFLSKLYNNEQEGNISRKEVTLLMMEKMKLIKDWARTLQENKL